MDDDLQGTKHLQTFGKARMEHPPACHCPWTSAMAKVTDCCVLSLPTHPHRTTRRKQRLLGCLPKGMGPRSRKAASLQPSRLCLPQGKRDTSPREGHEGFLGAWKELVIAAHPCEGVLWFSPSKNHSGAAAARHSTAQGGLSAFGSFPTGRGNPRPSPAGSLVIAGKTGEERASRTLPASTARARHKHRAHQLSPAPRKQTTQAGEAMGCSGVIRTVSTARKQGGDILLGEGQGKCTHGGVSQERRRARMGQLPRKGVCFPTKAVPQG